MRMFDDSELDELSVDKLKSFLKDPYDLKG